MRVDELVTADDFAAKFDENLDAGTLYAKYRRLVAEQAALRWQPMGRVGR